MGEGAVPSGAAPFLSAQCTSGRAATAGSDREGETSSTAELEPPSTRTEYRYLLRTRDGYHIVQSPGKCGGGRVVGSLVRETSAVAICGMPSNPHAGHFSYQPSFMTVSSLDRCLTRQGDYGAVWSERRRLYVRSTDHLLFWVGLDPRFNPPPCAFGKNCKVLSGKRVETPLLW